jgi:hypothetical protein
MNQEFRQISKEKKTSPKFNKRRQKKMLCKPLYGEDLCMVISTYLSRAKDMAKHGDGEDLCMVSSTYLTRSMTMAMQIHHRIDLAILRCSAMPRPTSAMARVLHW